LRDDHPVLEVAVLDVKRGQAGEFIEAFATAERIIAAAPGFGGLELRGCVEDDHRFVLLVSWESVESHEVGFRGSDAYQDWKALLHHFYEPFPVVQHYVVARSIEK
jgi:heme-degrading monooxygenase HmoA